MFAVLLVVRESAYLSRIFLNRVTHCLPSFLAGWCTDWCSWSLCSLRPRLYLKAVQATLWDLQALRISGVEPGSYVR
jgi:hypothetical protein